MTSSAQEIAAAARAVEGVFLERLATHADALASGLARSDRLVAWDREQLIGAMQTRVRQIAGQRLSLQQPAAVRVLERRGQPLECVDLVWERLRRGQRVFVEHEVGTCSVVLGLLRGIAHVLAPGSLTVAATAGPVDDDTLGPRVGIERPGPRVAMVDADADRELAAYVLARTSLRRSGTDPRAVKVAYVCGPIELLQRHLRRLWVGANIGPPTLGGSFAGPIEPGVREEFLAACQRWENDAGAEVWCRGGALDRSDDSGCYAAPALFFAAEAAPQLPMVGPMLVIVGCDAQQAKAGCDAAFAANGQAIQVGGSAGQLDGVVRHVRGALLVERLPPGLPDPRPV